VAQSVVHRGHLPATFLLCPAAVTFDAYVATNNTVKLIDFNPVGGTTSPLLFTWRELGLEQAAGEATAEEELESQGEQRASKAEGQGQQGSIQGQGANASTAAGAVGRSQQQVAPPALNGLGGTPGGSDGYGGEDGVDEGGEDEGSLSGECDSDDEISSRVMVRIVPSAGIVQPGQRAVCGMPIDMLQLKESVEGLVRLMAQQQGEQDT
jgi:hypothetical protein